MKRKPAALIDNFGPYAIVTITSSAAHTHTCTKTTNSVEEELLADEKCVTKSIPLTWDAWSDST